MEKSIEIKQFIWLIILIAGVLIIASDTNIQYALGVVTSIVLKDGLILTAIVWGVTYKFRKRRWQWFDWLNVLAYTSLAATILYPFVEPLLI